MIQILTAFLNDIIISSNVCDILPFKKPSRFLRLRVRTTSNLASRPKFSVLQKLKIASQRINAIHRSSLWIVQ